MKQISEFTAKSGRIEIIGIRYGRLEVYFKTEIGSSLMLCYENVKSLEETDAVYSLIKEYEKVRTEEGAYLCCFYSESSGREPVLKIIAETDRILAFEDEEEKNCALLER